MVFGKYCVRQEFCTFSYTSLILQLSITLHEQTSQFGVFFQLIYPSSPIEMTYSEGAIAATKYMTAIFANILLSTVALRAVKNAINVRVCCGYEDEDEDEDEVADGQLDEDEAVTGYAQV